MHKTVVGIPEEKRPLGSKRRHAWIILMGTKERGFEAVNRIHVSGDTVHRRVLVNTVMDLWIPMERSFLID